MPAAGPQNTRRRQRRAAKRRSPTMVAPQGDTKGDSEFNKAKRFKHTRTFRKAMQEAYDAPRKASSGKSGPPTPKTQAQVDSDARDRQRKVDALKRKVRGGGRLSYAERGIIKSHSRREHKRRDILRAQAQHDVDYDGLEAGGAIDQFKDPKVNPAYELIQNFAQQQHYRKAKASGDEREADKLFGTPEKDSRKKSNIEKFDRAEHAGLLTDPLSKAYGGLLHKSFSGADFLLEQAARPSHLITGTEKALVEGKNPLSAVVEGGKNFITGETTGSDVAKAAGIKNKTVAGGLGFVNDAATDPLNLLTFGTATPARIAARKAFEGALKDGLDHREALEVATKVFDQAPAKGAGISAGLRARVPFTNVGGEVRTSGKGTARVSQGLKSLTRPATHRKAEVEEDAAPALGGARGEPRSFTRLMGHAKTELNRNAGHEGIHPVREEYIRKGVQEGRGHRAKLESWAVNRVHAYRKHIHDSDITPEQQTEMVHAIERNDLSELKPEVRELAEAIKSDLDQVGDEATRLGILDALIKDQPAPHGQLTFDGVDVPDDSVKGYFPRTARDPERTTAGAGHSSVGMTVTGNASRKVHERIETLSPEKQDFYLTDDAPRAVGQRLLKHANQVGQATMLNKLADLAKPLHHADDLEHVAADEWDRVMVKSPKGFTPLLKTKGFQPDPAEARAAVAKALEEGREVVVVPQEEFELARKLMTRGELSRTAAGSAFDRVHGGVKGGLTLPNPGFHLTNAVGDTWNARLGGARFHSFPRALQLASKERGQARRARSLTGDAKSSKLERGGKVEKYGDQKLSDAELVDLAGQHGVLQRGLSQEIYGLKGGAERELKGGEWKTGPLAGRRRPMEALRHLSEAREDIGRLWSFHDAMKRGLSPEDAATHVNKHHFDYTDFTETERAALKRFIPFYMFWSRNTPLQAGGLLGRPGQFANMELAREESFKAAGLDPDDKKKLQKYEQQGLPFALPFKVDGNPVLIYPKLPATDLNLIPGSLGLKEGAQNLGEQALQRFTPVIKTPLELLTGYDFFFKQEADKLSAAPGRLFGSPKTYADAKAINKQAGFKLITMEVDAKSGKLIPKWPRWMDKTARFLPWTNFASSLATDKTPNQKDTKAWMSAISQFTGTRPAMVDWADEKTSELFDKLEKEEEARDALGKQVHRNSDEEWSDVADRPGEEGRIARRRNAHADKVKQIQAEIAGIQQKAGWKNPYFRDMLPKKKSPLEQIQANLKDTRNNAMGGKGGKKPAWLKNLEKLKGG